MKRYIALTLATILSFSTYVSAFANDVTDSIMYADNFEDAIALTYIDHGSFEFINPDVKTTTDAVNAFATEYEGIYQLEDGQYVAHAIDDIFWMVEKEDLDLDNMEANEMLFEEKDFPDELIQSIEENIHQQEAIGNEDFAVSIFVPAMMETTRAKSQTTYYTFDGHKFRDTLVYYQNKSSHIKDVATGKDTVSRAKSLTSLIVSVGGANKYISIFGVGMSAYDLYKNLYGPVAHGTSDDYLQMNIIYDKYEKLTEGAASGTDSYTLGHCKTSKVNILTYEIYQYYQALGETLQKKVSVDGILESENYARPALKVLNNLPKTSHLDDDIFTRIFGFKFIF